MITAPFKPLVGFLNRLSTGGLLLGLLFFALSLTPSLLPRNFVLQGVLSGCVFAAGYGIGVFCEWAWNFLELSIPNEKFARRIKFVIMLACAVLAIVCLWYSTSWQNAVRAVMHDAPVHTRQPLFVAAISLAPATLLIAIGTLVVHGVRWVARPLRRVIPPRVALATGMLVVWVLASMLVNGVLVRGALYAADRFYADLDQLAGQYEDPPIDPLASGSAASLVPWDTIGLDARTYVRSGPSADEIATLIGRPAVEPLRVYVGLRSAETVEQRAQLALDEMIRVGAFERSVLVLIMPVGTGWVDPPAIDTLEFLHAGDVASVALQYSYLTSWLSLVVEPDVGTGAAQALFHTVYNYWTELPADQRPKLYLHGLSLGAYASQASASLYTILADPFQGALWVGPPFASQTWRNATANRVPGSPYWLPRVEDGSVLRFANQTEGLEGTAWGPVRLVYLQYASDPIVFFDPAILYRPPAWLGEPRGPDVSPGLNWYPVVTFLQLALDLTLSQEAPVGYGHVYAPPDYLKAWVAVTDPPGWDAQSLAALSQEITRSGDKTTIVGRWFCNGPRRICD